MNIISTISNKRFSLNGIEYLKNYVSRVAGDKVEIFNNYERSDVLVSLQHYSEFRVDGVDFDSATELQSALLPVIFSRGTLGNDVAEINQNNIVRVQYYFVGMDDDIYAIVDKINTGESFTVEETEIIVFHCFAIQDYFNSKTEKYFLTGLGKGTYGSEGIQITSENLTFINRNAFAADSDPRTEIIPFQIYGSQTITQWLNTRSPALAIQSQSDGYTVFKGTINDANTSFLWIGSAGTYGTTWLQSTINDFQLLDQEVINTPLPLIKSYMLANGVKATEQNVAEALNTRTNLMTGLAYLFPIVVSATSTPVIFQVRDNINGIVTIYNYLFKKGAGAWGYRGTEFSPADLFLISSRPLVLSDIDTDPNTVTVNLGTIPDSDFLTVGNAAEHDFGDATKAYYFVYVTNAVSYTQRFIGTPGIYGGGTMANFTEEMFATGPTSETPPVPGMNDTNAAGNTIVNQSTTWAGITSLVVSALGWVFKQFGYNINIVAATAPSGSHPAEVTYTIPAKTADDTFAMISDVEGYKKLNNDFLIFVSNQSSGTQFIDEVRYFTDKERSVRLNDYLPSGYQVLSTAGLQEVILTGNDDLLFIANNPTAVTLGMPILFVRMVNPRLESNVLKWDSLKYENISIVPGRIHSARCYRGFLYACTRTATASASTVATRLFKINPYDFTDVKYIDLALADFPNHRFQRIELFKNKIYAVGHNGSTNLQVLVEINEDMTGYRKLVDLPSAYRALGAQPLIVHKEQIYMPFSDLTTAVTRSNTAGIVVYDLEGNYVRSNIFMNTGTSQSTYIGYCAHWMGVFNDKIIITPTSTNCMPKILRVDVATLGLDEQKDMTQYATNNNCITSDGYLFYNEEALIAAPRNQRKIKYNNFADDTIIISNFSSSGCIDPVHDDDIIISKISQLKNDIGTGATPPPATSTALGTVKLYTTTGNNTDGTIDQNTYTLGISAKANDADVLHKNGNESVAGTKTFANIGVNSINPNSDNGFSWGSALLRAAQLWAVRGKFNVWQPSASGANMDIQDFSNNVWGRINAITGNFTWGGATDNAVGKLQVIGQVTASDGLTDASLITLKQHRNNPTIITGNVISTVPTNTKYITNAGTRLTVPLPLNANSSIGDFMEIRGLGTGGWRLSQPEAATFIHSSSDTTIGTSGYIQSSGRYDTIRVEKIAANEWIVVQSTGLLTIN